MRELSTKVAVVTGGASGIGKALATRFRDAGMHVVIADVEAGALDAAATELGVVGVRTDVSDAVSVQALADDVRERFGTAHLLCNNAGVGGGGLIADQTLADWEWVLGVNLWGVIHGLHSFLPMLLDERRRRSRREHRLRRRPPRRRGHRALQREQVSGRRDQRDASQGARHVRCRRRCVGAVPRLRAHEHLREPAQPAGGPPEPSSGGR